MISVLVERNKKGLLLSCKAKGHACYARKGFDIVCSSVTVIIRTIVKVLESLKGIKLDVDAHKRGYLSFCVNVVELSSEEEQKLVYAGDFLEIGLKSISDEFPEYVKLLNKTV